jgi:hypothetical protein
MASFAPTSPLDLDEVDAGQYHNTAPIPYSDYELVENTVGNHSDVHVLDLTASSPFTLPHDVLSDDLQGQIINTTPAGTYVAGDLSEDRWRSGDMQMTIQLQYEPNGATLIGIPQPFIASPSTDNAPSSMQLAPPSPAIAWRSDSRSRSYDDALPSTTPLPSQYPPSHSQLGDSGSSMSQDRRKEVLLRAWEAQKVASRSTWTHVEQVNGMAPDPHAILPGGSIRYSEPRYQFRN